MEEKYLLEFRFLKIPEVVSKTCVFVCLLYLVCFAENVEPCCF